MAEVSALNHKLDELNVVPVFVHMGEPARFEELAERFKAGDIPAISDPDKELYRHFGVKRARIGQMLSIKNWGRGLSALWNGHGFGSIEGDPMQMPAVILLRDGEVVASYHHDTPSDQPDYLKLARSTKEQGNS